VHLLGSKLMVEISIFKGLAVPSPVSFLYIRPLTPFHVLLPINVNEMGSHGVHVYLFYNVCIGLRMA
jgi:hypothetical protein